MKNTIFVCENGWIICGAEKADTRGTQIHLENAFVVRRWSNGRGIGALAREEYKHEYTLDEIGAVDIFANKVLFEIPCEW